MTERRWLSFAALGGLLATIYAMTAWILASGMIHVAPVALGAGVTIDLTLTAAGLTWLFASRHGYLPRRAPIVVLVLGLAAAQLALPADARDGFLVLRVLWAAVETFAFVAIVRQLGQIRARYRERRVADVESGDALAFALSPTIGPALARLFATELDALGHAFGAWRRVTPAEDERTFSMHRRSHHALIVGVVLFILVGETAATHWMVAKLSHAVAWVLTIGSIWAALWLLGDVHAVRLRPLRLRDDGIDLRVGFRWRAFVPYAAIRDARLSASPPRGKTTLVATVAGAADVELRLDRLVEARGLFGRTRRFDHLLLSVDRAAGLVRALRGCETIVSHL